MFLISDDNAEYDAHEWRKLGLFGEKKAYLGLLSILSNNSLCSLRAHLNVSELPSNVSFHLQYLYLYSVFAEKVELLQMWFLVCQNLQISYIFTYF